MQEDMRIAVEKARKLLTKSEAIVFDYFCEIYPSKVDTHELMLALAERSCHRFSARRTNIDRKLADLGFRITTQIAGKPGAKTHIYGMAYKKPDGPETRFDGNQGILPLGGIKDSTCAQEASGTA